MEAIKTKAISQFMDHTYPAIEEATMPSRGHSNNIMNKESYFHLKHISIKTSNALDKGNGGNKLSSIWHRAALPWFDFISTATVCLYWTILFGVWFDFDWITENNSLSGGKKHMGWWRKILFHSQGFLKNCVKVEAERYNEVAVRQSPFLSSPPEHEHMSPNSPEFFKQIQHFWDITPIYQETSVFLPMS